MIIGILMMVMSSVGMLLLLSHVNLMYGMCLQDDGL